MSKIDSLIQEFVINLRRAIAEEAAEAFAIAGRGGDVVVSRVKKEPAAKRKRGSKRTTEEIAAQGANILSYLKKNPASGAEALGAGLRMNTADLALPIAKLIADKSVKFVGQKRGRKYSVR